MSKKYTALKAPEILISLSVKCIIFGTLYKLDK